MDVVLVVSEEGDCAAVVENLAADFTVMTFDTPGFLRTSDPADPSAMTRDNLPGQIASLLASLDKPKRMTLASRSEHSRQRRAARLQVGGGDAVVEAVSDVGGEVEAEPLHLHHRLVEDGHRDHGNRLRLGPPSADVPTA